MVGASVVIAFSGAESKEIFGVDEVTIKSPESLEAWVVKVKDGKSTYRIQISNMYFQDKISRISTAHLTKQQIPDAYHQAVIDVAKEQIEIYKSKN